MVDRIVAVLYLESIIKNLKFGPYLLNCSIVQLTDCEKLCHIIHESLVL